MILAFYAPLKKELNGISFQLDILEREREREREREMLMLQHFTLFKPIDNFIGMAAFITSLMISAHMRKEFFPMTL